MSQPANKLAIDASESTVDAFKADVSPATVTTVKRVLNIQISGSLTKLSQDGDSACRWKTIDGKQTQVFGLESGDSVGMDTSTASNSLRGATIISARLLETKNDFPYPLGITVSCLPRDEMVDTGERYTYTALAKSYVNTPYTLFEADARTQDSQRWRNKYKEYNAANLETQGVLEVKQCPYVFVKDTHPIVDVLRINRDLIGSDIDTHQKIDNEWFKVSRQVMQECCKALRSKVLSKIPSHDLNLFSVAMERAGGQDWLDIGDGALPLASFTGVHCADEELPRLQQKHIEEFLNREHQYSARLEITYELQH
jgi:hypothetical protein